MLSLPYAQKKKYDGIQLNTGELSSFMTGSLDTLFTEIVKVKKKKSFIGFLLDASGSMHSGMLRTDEDYHSELLKYLYYRCQDNVKQSGTGAAGI